MLCACNTKVYEKWFKCEIKILQNFSKFASEVFKKPVKGTNGNFTTLNSLLSTVKPVSSSLKTKETLKRVSKVSRNEVPIQAKKLKLDDKIESAQKGVETEGHVREGLSPQFLDKLLLRRKVLISASTTKTIGVQNASA